jgi:hypothetical protein
MISYQNVDDESDKAQYPYSVQINYHLWREGKEFNGKKIKVFAVASEKMISIQPIK